VTKVTFWLPLVLVATHVFLFYRATVAHNDGTFSYPLDDAFIHLAIARHLAQDGVYGVTTFAFTPASSSVIWPFLLAGAIKVFGNRVLLPLLLNCLIAVAFIAVVSRVLSRVGGRTWTKTLAAVAVVVLMPLSTVVFLGMEHTLHALATLLVVSEAAEWLADATPSRSAMWRVAACAALATSARYEAVFVVAVVAGIAVCFRRLGAALGVAAAGALPIVAFGLYSLRRGGMFLPNSVVLKGRQYHWHDLSDVSDFFGGDFFSRTSLESYLFVLLVTLVVLFAIEVHQHGLRTPHALRLGITASMTALHVQFAALGWFFRYEAYAIAVGVTVVGAYACDRLPSAIDYVRRARHPVIQSMVIAAAITIIGAPPVRRILTAASVTPSASRNIYEQQMQMARFLEKYFDHEPVAINDIGAVAYLRSGPIVDLLGLATTPVAIAKHLDILRPLRPEKVAELTRDANVAVIYDEWFPDAVPPTWTRVGRWVIDGCRSCAFPDLSIYATNAAAIPRVVQALRDFRATLPARVHEEGRYVQIPPADGSSDYRLCEGDVLRVKAPGLDPRYRALFYVAPDGRIPYPFTKPVDVRGKTLAEASVAINDAMKESADPDLPKSFVPVEAALVTPRARRYMLTGNAYRVGDMWTDTKLTLSAAIERAGGRTERASGEPPFVLREGPAGFGVLTGAGPAGDFVLEPLDIVVVP
jgi:hypothetical protein